MGGYICYNFKKYQKGVFMETKKCSKCKIKKSLDNYYFIKNKGIYYGTCRDCKREIKRIRDGFYENQIIKNKRIELIKNGLKKCTKCHQIKPLTEFKERGGNDKYSKLKRGECDNCDIKRYERYRGKNFEKIKESRLKKYYSLSVAERTAPTKNFYQTWQGKYSMWTCNARRRNIKWNLSLEFLKSIPLVCYYTGIKLTLKSNLENSISLDRIDSSKEYTEDNVVFCCKDINRMKRDFDKNKFFTFCKLIVKHHDL